MDFYLTLLCSLLFSGVVTSFLGVPLLFKTWKERILYLLFAIALFIFSIFISYYFIMVILFGE